VLQYLPADHPARARFEQQFEEMATRLVGLQQADGLWRASLLDPDSFPLKETSGSSLYAYAFAWGVNQGLLDRAIFEPSVRKTWNALVADVQADGKLTHVQPIGHDPRAFDENSTEVYGVGGFLLAGSEVYHLAVLATAPSNDKPMVVTVHNPTSVNRVDEIVEVDLVKPANLGKAPLIMEPMTSRILSSQITDNKLLFQATLMPGETHRYLVLPSDRVAAVPPADVKTYARFVPERLDDFAWENDRIAHRVYGPAIMSDPKQDVSSGVDVWVKSVRYPVVDKWYKAGNYHKDHGEGVDNYHVGTSRGCGGISIVDGKTTYSSSVFKTWKLLANGPLRSTFELSYDYWDAGKRKVAQTERVSIDAGANFSRVESVFTSNRSGPLLIGVGVAQRKGDGRVMKDEVGAALSYWEPELPPNGNIACGVVIPDEYAAGFADIGNSFFALGKAAAGKPFVHYLGAGWSKSGDFPAPENWENYVREFAMRLKSPLQVTVEDLH
jgi:unsaturated rhamnogalacturonyl hydrolase